MSRGAFRYALLGSGSRGNGLVVQKGEDCALIDCGFPVAETVRRLARLGLGPETIKAVFVTHEHGDHASGAGAFARRHGCALWATRGTLRALGDKWSAGAAWHPLMGGESVTLGGLEFMPYTVPHDAGEPVQFVIGDGARRLGLLTDTGHGTRHVEQALAGVDDLILECNHDPAMLEAGPYPPGLRARVGGDFGHLSNAQAADILSRVRHPGLARVVAAHLSEKNNRPALAQAALAGALGCDAADIEVADQDHGSGWR